MKVIFVKYSCARTFNQQILTQKEMRVNLIICFLLLFSSAFCDQRLAKDEVLSKLNLANSYWQEHHKPTAWAFWDVAAYHTGNMELYKLTQNESYRAYSRSEEHTSELQSRENPVSPPLLEKKNTYNI